MTYIIYRLFSKIEDDKRFYIGSTKNIKNRMKAHKNYPNGKRKVWFKEVGFKNIQYEILEEFKNITTEEVIVKEDEYINKYLHNDVNCMNNLRSNNKKICKHTGKNTTKYKQFWRCDLENNKLQHYQTTKEAAEWIKKNNNIETSVKYISDGICQSLRGKRLIMYGFKWVSDTDDLPGEFWKEIYHKYVGNVKGIFVSSEGRIKRDNKITYGSIDGQEYLNYAVHNISYRVNRLVALTFLPNFKGLPLVDHKDGNKSNNRLYNLRWFSFQDNCIHSYKLRNGLY